MGFESQPEGIDHEFDALPNFKTIGRQGALLTISVHWTQWILALGLLNGLSIERKTGSGERERTEHFPVLD